MKTFDTDLIKQANGLLKFVSIEVRSGNFYVRGTFPGKKQTESPKQRSISLKLRATNGNWAIARRKATAIDLELEAGKFDWTNYDRKLLLKKQTIQNDQIVQDLYAAVEETRGAKTCGEWLYLLEREYWSCRQKTPTKVNTWKKNYELYFNQLPKDLPLSFDLLRSTVETCSTPSTRKRQLMANAYELLNRLAFPEKKGQINVLGRGYKRKKFDVDALPTDERIISIAKSIKDPSWKLVYSLMATYGIRPSEIRCLDFRLIKTHPYILIVSDSGKTGSREVFPCRSDWPELLGILESDFNLPKISAKCNNDLNPAISKKFKKLKTNHRPGALRDAYCIRLSLCGVPIEFAARWAGHSIAIHEKNYLDAINRKHNLQIFKSMQTSESDVPVN